MPDRILLAEDDAALRRSLRFILQQEGWETIEAAGASEALDRARTEAPDLLLVERSLPPAGAIALLRTLRGDLTFRDLPVLLLTGEADSRERAAGLEAGADDTIGSPFDPRELVARLRAHLRLRRLRRELLEGERLRVTLETAGAACHELSQPLTVMCGSAELLLMKMPEADPLRRLAQAVLDSGARATELLHQLQGIHSYHTRPYLDRSILDLERSSGRGGSGGAEGEPGDE